MRVILFFLFLVLPSAQKMLYLSSVAFGSAQSTHGGFCPCGVLTNKDCCWYSHQQWQRKLLPLRQRIVPERNVSPVAEGIRSHRLFYHQFLCSDQLMALRLF